MIGFLRLAIFGVIGAALAYWVLLIYARSLQREALEKDWARDHPGDGDSPARDAYINEGLAAYERSLRRKVLWLVLVLPAVVVGTLIYLLNYA